MANAIQNKRIINKYNNQHTDTNNFQQFINNKTT